MPGRPLAFRLVAPGVWKATLGTPEDLTLLSAAGDDAGSTGSPRDDRRRRFRWRRTPASGGSPPAGWRCDFPWRSTKTSTVSAWTSPPCAAPGSAFQLHVDHWNGRTGRTHAPVPFYVSTKGYGVFIDSSRYLTVTVGLGVRTAATVKPPPIDRTTHAKDWVEFPRSDSIEAPRARAGRRRLRLRRPDDVGRRAPVQPVLRRRRPAAEVGPGLHDAHADGLHRRAGAGRSRRVPQRAASRST